MREVPVPAPASSCVGRAHHRASTLGSIYAPGKRQEQDSGVDDFETAQWHLELCNGNLGDTVIIA